MGNFSNFSHYRLVSLTLTVISLLTFIAEAETNIPPPNDSYVKKACKTTLYTAQCYKSLSPYSSKINSNPNSLCKYAVSVALADARGAKSMALKISRTKALAKNEKAVARDCASNIDDTVDELAQCYKELDKAERLSKAKRRARMDNVRTWASAALTDDSTCTDEMVEMKVSPATMSRFKKSVEKVSRSTSILLALVKSYCTD